MENVTINSTYLYSTTSLTGTSNSTTLPTVVLKERHIAGIALAIFGNCLISVALNLQKYAHNRLDGENYCTSKIWWGGMIAMGLGELGNFLAYGFAPASLVAPLGCVGVLSNSIIAFIFLKEKVSTQSVMGVALIIVGSVILVSFSTKDHPVLTVANITSYLKNWVFIVYIILEAIVLCVVLFLIYYKDQETIVSLLVVVAILASLTVIAAKAVSSLLSESVITGKQRIINPAFWVMLLSLPMTTIPQIRFLNRAMQLYDVSDVVPVNFIFFTVSAILAGTVFYQELSGLPATKIIMFIFGCVVSFIGVFIIMRRNKHHDDKSETTPIIREDGFRSQSSSRSSLTNEDDFTRNESTPILRPKSTLLLKHLASLVKQTERIEQVQPIAVQE